MLSERSRNRDERTTSLDTTNVRRYDHANIARCLFIRWKDGTSSQYSVPDDYTLTRRGLEQPPLPQQLEILDLGQRAELYINTDQILSAYAIDIGADRIITGSPA